MIRHLLTLFIALTVFTGKAWADKPTISFIVPYKVVCEKQADGTKQIRVKVGFRKAGHALIVNSEEGRIFTDDSDPFEVNNTTVLQATEPCKKLTADLNKTGKLYGFEAALIGTENECDFFTFQKPDDEIQVDLCAYLINVNLSRCDKTLEELLDGKVYLDTDETIVWVDLGNFDITKTFSANENLILADAPYATDFIIHKEQFDPSNITIVNVLYNVAVKNLHGQPCCFENFGLDEQNAQRILCDLLSKLNGCPTEFSGKGTWGSCGDTANVKLSGTMTKPIIIDVCGKKLCFSELPSVRDRNVGESFELGTTPGSQTALCFSEFFIEYLQYQKDQEESNSTFNPKIGQCGIPAELNMLIQGRSNFFNGVLIERASLKLICVDPANHIYAFGLLFSHDDNSPEILIILGCRFKLEDCPKCCK